MMISNRFFVVPGKAQKKSNGPLQIAHFANRKIGKAEKQSRFSRLILAQSLKAFDAVSYPCKSIA